jgi:hypothetical protein
MSWKSILKAWPEEVLIEDVIYTVGGALGDAMQYVGPEGRGIIILTLEDAKKGEMALGAQKFGAKIQPFKLDRTIPRTSISNDEYTYEERDAE